MASLYLVDILGIAIKLVSDDPRLDQNSTQVRDFKAATSRLIAHLSEKPPTHLAQDIAAKPPN